MLDAEPEAMARTLDDPPQRPELELEWTSEGDMGDIARLNDLAYQYELGSFGQRWPGCRRARCRPTWPTTRASRWAAW